MAQSSMVAAAKVKRAASRKTIDHGRERSCSSASEDEVSIGIKDISDPADCLNHFLIKRIIHFSTQTSHHHINDVCPSVEINIPNLFYNRRSRNDVASRGSQVKEKGEF